MTDYPDWQASASTQSGNVFPAFSQVLAPGAHPGVITPVFSWESLAMTVVPSAGAAKVSVSHYADLAGTQLVGADTWTVNATTSLTVRVPLRGPYAQLSVTVTSAGNLTAKTWGAYQTPAADRISFPVAGQIIFEADHVLPASTSKTYVFPQICAGSANWSFVPFDTTGKLNPFVQIVDELGTVIARVSDRGNPVTIDNALLQVPDSIVQVVVTNEDGAATHEYGFSLIVPPQ